MYLKGPFLIDFCANVPIFIYELTYGWPLEPDEVEKMR